MAKPIVLIGFSGSGKSTIGKRLAAHFLLPFFDADAVFEEKYKISIPDFFAKYGENVFRICERAVFLDLLKREDCVIATGGGTPCFFDTMDRIIENSVSVYVKLSPKSLCSRLLNAKKVRPLTAGKTEGEMLEYIESELAKREKFYLRATHVVKGESLNVKEIFGAQE